MSHNHLIRIFLTVSMLICNGPCEQVAFGGVELRGSAWPAATIAYLHMSHSVEGYFWCTQSNLGSHVSEMALCELNEGESEAGLVRGDCERLVPTIHLGHSDSSKTRSVLRGVLFANSVLYILATPFVRRHVVIQC